MDFINEILQSHAQVSSPFYNAVDEEGWKVGVGRSP